MQIDIKYYVYVLPLWPLPSIWLAQDLPSLHGSSRHVKAILVLALRVFYVQVYLDPPKISVVLLRLELFHI